MMRPHGLFTWTDLAAPDVERAKAFYGGLFGWEADDQFDEDGTYLYTMFRIDGASVAGLGSQPAELAAAGVPPMWASYVAVESLDEAVAAVETNGGTVLMPPMDVMDAGRMAFIADPAGATLALWEPIGYHGAELFNDPGAMTWNELSTRDAEAAMRFYGAVFGWGFFEFPDQPGYWMITVEGKVKGDGDADDDFNGGILSMDETWPEDAPQFWMVYFRVEDADAATVRVEELGGSVMAAPFDSPAGRIAVLAGPAGAAFSAIALPDPAA